MNIAKTELRGKFITQNAYTRKEETSQISIISSHFKALAKKNKIKSTLSIKKKTIKVGAKIIELENTKTTEKKSWFFKNINKMNKLLAKLTKIKRRHRLSVSEKRQGLSLQILQPLKIEAETLNNLMFLNLTT